MGFIMMLVVIGTAVWAGIDANSIKAQKNLPVGPGGNSPIAWALFVGLLWIIGFPFYLIKRSQALSAPATVNADQQRCPHCDEVISARAKVCPRCQRDIAPAAPGSPALSSAPTTPGLGYGSGQRR